MYWLIEDEKQLEVLQNSSFKSAYIEVIPFSNNVHPSQTQICAIYLRPLEASKGFMLCINHSETFSVNYDEVYALLNKFDALYTLDKKEILHYFSFKTLYDINLSSPTYIPSPTHISASLNARYPNRTNINLIVPIVKLYETCEENFLNIKAKLHEEKTEYSEFYNNKTSVVFNAIERSGIKVDIPTFEQHFHPTGGNEYVYTKFNLKTTTTRPSNSFKNVNYAALNKENGCRKSFIPRNSRFIEIDISAYHPTLAARLVNYKFPTNDIHGHFASLYNVGYKKSKELTFKQLYGGVFESYKELEFFQRIEKYVGELWSKFQSEGFVDCKVSGFRYESKNLQNMNPQKLFNYILQQLETSVNILILWDILRLLVGKNTKMVLYTYDSFTFDFDEDEGELLEDIYKVFGKYSLGVKSEEGLTYDFKSS